MSQNRDSLSIELEIFFGLVITNLQRLSVFIMSDINYSKYLFVFYLKKTIERVQLVGVVNVHFIQNIMYMLGIVRKK